MTKVLPGTAVWYRGLNLLWQDFDHVWDITDPNKYSTGWTVGTAKNIAQAKRIADRYLERRK